MRIQNLFGVINSANTPVPAVPTNGASGVFMAVADASNFRKGLVRFVFTVRGTTPACNCTADLNILEAINTSDNINRLTSQCIANGATNIPFIIDPKFSRAIGDGIGVDQYSWVFTSGTWGLGNPSGSGDNSAKTRNAPATIPQPSILQVTQGTACNTVTRNLIIQSSVPIARITPSSINGAYTGLADGVPFQNLTACLNAGVGNTPVTLTAPAGGTYNWTLPNGFTYATGSATTPVITVNTAGNRSGLIQLAFSPTPGTGCGSSTLVTLVIKRLTVANVITLNSAKTSCFATLPYSGIASISLFPPDGVGSFEIIPIATPNTGITIGPTMTATGGNGSFPVTIATGATTTGSTFALQARNILTYTCTGNSTALTGLQVPNQGSTNFVLYTYDVFPHGGNGTNVTDFRKRTIFWGTSTPSAPINDLTLHPWTASKLGTGCDETTFDYVWSFNGTINGIAYNDMPSGSNNGSVGFPFTNQFPAQFVFFRSGQLYGAESVITATIRNTTPASTCNSSAYTCFTATRTTTLAAAGTPQARQAVVGGNLDGKNVSSSIRPNPNKGLFNLFVELDQRGKTAYITDIQGKIVFKTKQLLEEQQIDLKWLSKGIYTFTIEDSVEGKINSSIISE